MEQEKLQEILERYAKIRDTGGQELIVTLLREIQDAEGYIPDSLHAQAARAMQVSPAVITALIKRIPGFKSAPSKYAITVCTGPRCAAKGSREILRTFETILHIRAGQATPDGLISLETQNCFKKCGSAPNVRCGHTIYTSFSPDQAAYLIAKLRDRQPDRNT